MPSSSVSIVSKCTICPQKKSESNTKKPLLKLSVSDLPMLSCHYIQKGVLLSYPPYSLDDLVSFLKHSLSSALTHFPALAGRLVTDSNGYVHIECNDAGVDFILARAKHLSTKPILSPLHDPLRERIFHFTRESILKLKLRANSSSNGNNNYNNQLQKVTRSNGHDESAEILGKQCNDLAWRAVKNQAAEISSFQSLCAQLWRSVTRARKLDANKTTTFRMAVNCRHRLEPKLDPYYFGNAIQSIPTIATVGDVVNQDLRWCGDLLHKNVVAHDNETVRRGVKDWERSPRLFPLGNFDGAMITMGSSPRFPMYDNDFGWGKPLAIRSGGANKFDGKISAFPGREGNGSVDLEVVLSPETMAGLESDTEFLQYVSEPIY
ncbi:bahd acyltransferase dcr [Quercus suber]|uniref:Bahd acyltransferase dcr n=1 Tax=Quercus suber TaxID=58331 RepID=A0AAW0LUY4_QUESU